MIKDNGITPESRMFSYAFISALKSKSKDLYFLIDDSTFTYRDQSLNLKVKMLSANAI